MIGRTFSRIATTTSTAMGHWGAFAVALLIVLGWAAVGPAFGFSTVWQLVINTGTTIITFLMVFLIQHQQNADTSAIQRKLDELILAVDGADDRIAGIERKRAEG